MLYIESDNKIRLTRGDTARLEINVTTADESGSITDYKILPEDTLTLSVKKKVKDSTYILQKTINGSTVFHIKPEDTRGVSFGTYVYDVQLTTSDGDVYTIIEPTSFEIMTEVTTT